ncbi:hypothetical protein M8R20_10235 [Pseudomonas sp. R2.Fl]|nr:hypothetical protein [Pseudomonas sp. R2.Fl]
MNLSRISLGFAVGAALAALASSSFAGEHSRRHHHHHGGFAHHGRAVVGGDGLPSVVPGLGTFAGSIAAVRVKGNGIYFASDISARKAAPYQAPKARIIEVSQENPQSACSFEAGVCVIRP